MRNSSGVSPFLDSGVVSYFVGGERRVSVGKRVEGKTAAVADWLVSAGRACGGGACGSGALAICTGGGVTLAWEVGRVGEGCLCGILVTLRLGRAAATNKMTPKNAMKRDPVAAPAIIRSTAKKRRPRFNRPCFPSTDY